MTSLIIRRSRFPSAGLLLITLGAVGLDRFGFLADAPTLTVVASLALLVFGLPHGAFDLALLRRAAGTSFRPGSSLAVVALYLGCSAAMYLSWRVGPVFALAGFLVMAVAHFAEDWDACGSRLIAYGIAAAIVSAPAILHVDQLRSLFALLTGDPAAAVLADMMLLVAPVAIAVALIGWVLLWQAGHRALAVSAGCAFAAMLLLPPVPGFALFFCLVHSPIQFRQHAGLLGLRGFQQWGGMVVPLSLAGLGIAAAVFFENGDASIPANLFATSFMTLSILTVPHMLMPRIAAFFFSCNAGFSDQRSITIERSCQQRIVRNNKGIKLNHNRVKFSGA
ncbi:MAG: Brp/Blh family beta-carotene 15,15'-dioxygenase [Sandarakinorhabdus sp.]|nr:Brp/Blh family beta-carotene 15,15'-dioxygenase [Sandarakinorhabdus sp.]